MAGTFDIVSRVELKAEDVLPLELIREHTKTDDTPSVTDRQLELYRATSFEQAELYTSRIILGYASIQERFREDVSREHSSRRRGRSSIRLELSYLPLEKFVLITDPQQRSKTQVEVKRNNRKLDVPFEAMAIDVGNCCAGNGLNADAVAFYTTGYRNKEDIPATMLYGCLKFIAWSVNNAGDELITIRNRIGTTETGLIGTNNAAWGSGAIEHWKPYKVR